MTNLLLKLFVKDYKNTSDQQVRKKYGLLGSYFGLITNFIIFLCKVIVGIFFHFYSIIADSINNLSDFGNNFLSISGFKISSKKPDKEHPFGHQRMEYVMSLIIGCIIVSLGVVMLYQGVRDLIAFITSMINDSHPIIDNTFKEEQGWTNFIITLSILIFSIFLKILQSFLYRSLSKRINSLQLKALSNDSRNDVIATSLVLAGILITYFTGYNVDCFFTLFVAILVIISGIGIIKAATTILLGQKPDQELVHKMIEIIINHKGVLGIHDLMMHYYGNNIYAVIHIEVDSKNSILESHELVDEIEREVKDKLNINLTVHMDPILVDDEKTDYYKKLVLDALKEYSKISIHDFRVVSTKDYDNLIFDMIVPDEIYNANFEERIKELITYKIKESQERKVNLIITFDDSITDYLNSEKQVSSIVDK